MQLDCILENEIYQALNPIYNREVFLSILTRCNIKQNLSLGYEIFESLLDDTFQPEGEIDDNPVSILSSKGKKLNQINIECENTFDYSEALFDLLQLYLSWDNINDAQIEAHEEDDSCEVLLPEIFILRLMLTETAKEKLALTLLKAWKDNISTKNMVLILLINEVQESYNGYSIRRFLADERLANPSEIIREFIIKNYTNKLGMRELLCLLNTEIMRSTPTAITFPQYIESFSCFLSNNTRPTRLLEIEALPDEHHLKIVLIDILTSLKRR